MRRIPEKEIDQFVCLESILTGSIDTDYDDLKLQLEKCTNKILSCEAKVNRVNITEFNTFIVEAKVDLDEMQIKLSKLSLLCEEYIEYFALKRINSNYRNN